MKSFKTRKRYRMVFINDNTLNTVWTLRLTRMRVWGLTALCVAAIAALVVCVVVWSPVSYLLPGYMRPDQRRTTVDNTLRVDSLLAAAETQNAYLANIINVICDPDSAPAAIAPEAPAEIGDTLMTATANERAFVESWLQRERGNLSVLSPIVAEGMLFRTPALGATLVEGSDSELTVGRAEPVVAIADGIVVDVRADGSGRNVAIIQHANDFLSIIAGLGDVTVSAGRRVVAGQVLGRAGADGRISIAVWHRGTLQPLAPLLKL